MSRFNYTLRPIEQWPGKLTMSRERSLFKAGWTQTEELFARELYFLHAKNVVLQVAYSEMDFKRDGGIRSNAKPDHPGVIVAFDSRFGPLQYATDNFDKWQDNVRAIALALEALRKVDRYGVSKRGEQYRGWKALGSGDGSTHGITRVMNQREAAEFLASLSIESPISGRELYSPAEVAVSERARKAAFRIAALRLHPDVGGNPADWKRLQEAMRVLAAADTSKK